MRVKEAYFSQLVSAMNEEQWRWLERFVGVVGVPWIVDELLLSVREGVPFRRRVTSRYRNRWRREAFHMLLLTKLYHEGRSDNLLDFLMKVAYMWMLVKEGHIDLPQSLYEELKKQSFLRYSGVAEGLLLFLAFSSGGVAVSMDRFVGGGNVMDVVDGLARKFSEQLLAAILMYWNVSRVRALEGGNEDNTKGILQHLDFMSFLERLKDSQDPFVQIAVNIVMSRLHAQKYEIEQALSHSGKALALMDSHPPLKEVLRWHYVFTLYRHIALLWTKGDYESGIREVRRFKQKVGEWLVGTEGGVYQLLFLNLETALLCDAGRYAEAVQLVEKFKRVEITASRKLRNRALLFRLLFLLEYNTACSYLGAGEFKKARRQLVKLLKHTRFARKYVPADLGAAVEFLWLAYNCCVGNFASLALIMQRVQRRFRESGLNYECAELIFSFCRKLGAISPGRYELISEIINELEAQMRAALEKDSKREGRFFYYFNWWHWLDLLRSNLLAEKRA